ncbi:HAD family hydrolase [Eubacterium sp. 1001713B170207_170306_E7]|uniref:HAD family hydrolase n=1 Tax=Eubacterium sp. 1001713B170207_170306_E7 TaxID=2787097 RepID=UPI001899E31A|nr:HAD family hydrolase [Eubacterium sp. 1001713B170207_170306_E7]
MLKAVFIDYTGTIMKEAGKDVEEMTMRLYKNSDIESPQAMLNYWWGRLKQYESESFGDAFLTEDEIVDRLLADCVEELHLEENLEEAHELCRRFWMYAPAFEDARPFFENCPLPIYVITNNGVRYVGEGMRDKGLEAAGIVSGDMARAYKPHKELFEKALEISGCSHDEVVHIGDSMTSDVAGARAAGIRPVLLDRQGTQEAEGVTVVRSLDEALAFIEKALEQ